MLALCSYDLKIGTGSDRTILITYTFYFLLFLPTDYYWRRYKFKNTPQKDNIFKYKLIQNGDNDLTIVHILYPVKTLENQMFSEVIKWEYWPEMG